MRRGAHLFALKVYDLSPPLPLPAQTTITMRFPHSPGRSGNCRTRFTDALRILRTGAAGRDADDADLLFATTFLSTMFSIVVFTPF